MIYVLVITQLTLAFVLILAAIGKFRNPTPYIESLAVFGIPGILKNIMTPLALTIPFVEIFIAAGLLMSGLGLLRYFMLANTILLVSFTMWMFWQRR